MKWMNEIEQACVDCELKLDSEYCIFEEGYKAGRDSMQKELTPGSLQSGIDDLLNENADLKAKAEKLVEALRYYADRVLWDGDKSVIAIEALEEWEIID